MQDKVMGKPSALKQVNLSLIRRAIMEKGSATRAEIVGATQISATTVRTLLTEMQRNHELVKVGYDESIGGRKATRYALDKERFFGVALCLDGGNVRYLTVDICGKIRLRGQFAADGNAEEAVCGFLDQLAIRIEIKAIGIGVPGIVSGMDYMQKNADGVLENHCIGEVVRNRYGVPVILENDLNAIALGFGLRYVGSIPGATGGKINAAYIYFEDYCLSAGFLADGRVLRGRSNFVGELGLFPVGDGQTLDGLLASPLGDKEYAELVAKLLAGVCCVLNPQYIALGGGAFRKDCMEQINRCFENALPAPMSAEIVYAQDRWQDYYAGLAYLTSEQIFAAVRLVKEGV